MEVSKTRTTCVAPFVGPSGQYVDSVEIPGGERAGGGSDVGECDACGMGVADAPEWVAEGGGGESGGAGSPMNLTYIEALRRTLSRQDSLDRINQHVREIT